jgi:hypothetical protein
MLWTMFQELEYTEKCHDWNEVSHAERYYL